MVAGVRFDDEDDDEDEDDGKSVWPFIPPSTHPFIHLPPIAVGIVVWYSPGHGPRRAGSVLRAMMRNRFQTAHVVFHSLGSLLLVLSGILVLPLAVAVLGGELSQGGHRTVAGFVAAAAVALGSGVACKAAFRRGTPNNVQAMLLCSLGWVAFSAVGAIPFVIGIGRSYLDGFFETMSGFTTTGITMFTGLDSMPRSVLFWRSLTQWLGGLGILTFFLAVTQHGGGAHRLFGAESHKIDAGRPVPGLAHTVKILWGIYALFTVVVAVGLAAAGMSWFDSVCHSFTALSTGGFSPHDASIEHYRLAGHAHTVWIEYILIVGMVAGGTNFLVHYRVLQGGVRGLIDNTEMRLWWGLLGGFVGLIFLERLVRVAPLAGLSPATGALWAQAEESFRGVVFQVVSILTTTGFGTRDIATPYFGHAARQLFLVMMVVGGCVGSTGGGIKVLRVAILGKLIRREVFRLWAPRRAVTTVVIDGKPVAADEIHRVSALFFAWVALLVVGGLVTALLSRHGGYESFSGMFSALGNIGPCYISVPDMGQLHPLVKVTYILGMLAGRLEILPVLLLFSRRAWRS